MLANTPIWPVPGGATDLGEAVPGVGQADEVEPQPCRDQRQPGSLGALLELVRQRQVDGVDPHRPPLFEHAGDRYAHVGPDRVGGLGGVPVADFALDGVEVRRRGDLHRLRLRGCDRGRRRAQPGEVGLQHRDPRRQQVDLRQGLLQDLPVAGFPGRLALGLGDPVAGLLDADVFEERSAEGGELTLQRLRQFGLLDQRPVADPGLPFRELAGDVPEGALAKRLADGAHRDPGLGAVGVAGPGPYPIRRRPDVLPRDYARPRSDAVRMRYSDEEMVAPSERP